MKFSAKKIAVLFTLGMAMFSCKKSMEKDAPTIVSGEQSSVTTQTKPINALVSDFIKEHPGLAIDSANVVHTFNKFMQFAVGDDQFSGKNPCYIRPIYAYGIEGVAYYEIWFKKEDGSFAGWVLLSSTDKDYPVVNFSHGTPYSSHLNADDNSKVYRFGVSYFALEKNGQKVEEYGQLPKYVVNSLVENGESGTSDAPSTSEKSPVEGVDYFLVSSYDDLKELFPKYYYTEHRKEVAKKMKNKLFGGKNAKQGDNLRTDAAYIYRWVSGSYGYYLQIPANTSVNTFPCWSGCNNNAWANIFLWWDRNMAKGNLIPTTTTGETSPLYRNTAARRAVSDPVQMYSRSVSGTYCGDGTGWTLWSNCYKAAVYPGTKGYGYSYQYRWCNSAGCHVDLANIVTDGIANNYRPVHIGANSHFYLGYGWAQYDTDTDLTWAYCYPGWNENNSDNVWIWWHDFNTSTKLFVN